MNQSNLPPDKWRKEDWVNIYITERVVSGLEKITGDIKDMLTNPLGLGGYIKKLAEKDDPLSYIPALLIVTGLIYFVAAKYGNEATGRMTIIISFSLATLIVIFRFIENYRRKRE